MANLRNDKRKSVTSRRAKGFSGRTAFNATLERMRSRLNWVIIRVPSESAKTLGSRGQIKVKGTMNGFLFRTSLFPDGRGGHILLVNKKMQKGGRVAAGGVARF